MKNGVCVGKNCYPTSRLHAAPSRIGLTFDNLYIGNRHSILLFQEPALDICPKISLSNSRPGLEDYLAALFAWVHRASGERAASTLAGR